MVRDRIAECFYGAHCADTGIAQNKGESEMLSQEYCLNIIKKGFAETGGDFDSPSKEDLQRLIGYLANFSKTFRDPEVIKKHAVEMMDLIERLD